MTFYSFDQNMATMSLGTVLIVDDEEKLLHLLTRIINLEGYIVYRAPNLKGATKILDKESVHVVLCDVKLPDGSGVDFTASVKERYPATEIILLTAYGNIADGVQAMKNGAFDYIIKGDDNEKIIPLLKRAMEKIKLQQKVQQLQQRVDKEFGFEYILGISPLIKEAIALAKKVAPTDATVMLLGETGTGKEVFAHAIHQANPRANNAFLALNCCAFNKELLESELFGHKAGAFTSAAKDKKGLIEEANGGTLFLDEIGEMPVELQSKLLRVLETNEFIKVGDTKSTRVDVRIVTATNRNLEEQIEKGQFRQDLFYRLNVFTIILPPLRERKEDILGLAQSFMIRFASKTNQRVVQMSQSFIDHLIKHPWKGNTRELKNIMERAVILATGPELTVQNLPLEMQIDNQKPMDSLSSLDLASVEMMHIQRILNLAKGNKTEAARLLNIGLTTLYRKIEEYGLTAS